MSVLSINFVKARVPTFFQAIRNYAAPVAGSKKKKLGKLGPVAEKKEIPVETDSNKLVNYVCGSNILKTGQDVKVSCETDNKLLRHRHILPIYL